MKNLYRTLSQPIYDLPYIFLLLLFETALSSLVVTHLPYTEIDWVAYMPPTCKKCRPIKTSLASDAAAAVWRASMESGEDFLGLDGSTSPIAIRKIQWVFVVMYLVNSAVVMALYQRVLSGMRQRQQQRDDQNLQFSALVWAWCIAMDITFLSKRIHSIFVLRLFNDAPAMLLLNLSMYLVACCDAWALGRVVFSLAGSIKMNIVLGWPFLSTYPVSYIKEAVEFDRVFFFKWTVNWKFLPEELFVSTMWALVLLSCH
ncbi:hypothetical protein HJC23_003690 [Cyclotella cryptica]|uniref:dolichyl-P-Man:Man5GlcNAc2-PP-dolichol alpha-1,3-mannosyltransferase n=1 Tax=Cyclotella cryptica TaxID=29204 RepID=A0ABD3P2K0_9STRA